jgi:hypothetical protein
LISAGRYCPGEWAVRECRILKGEDSRSVNQEVYAWLKKYLGESGVTAAQAAAR